MTSIRILPPLVDTRRQGSGTPGVLRTSASFGPTPTGWWRSSNQLLGGIVPPGDKGFGIPYYRESGVCAPWTQGTRGYSPRMVHTQSYGVWYSSETDCKDARSLVHLGQVRRNRKRRGFVPLGDTQTQET